MLEFFDGLLRRAAFDGHRAALVSPAGTLSYSALIVQVRAKAQAAARLPKRVGLLAADEAEAIVSDLALSFAGKEIVPLPTFFSDAQLSHIIQSAGLTDVVTDERSIDRARRLGLKAQPLSAAGVSDAPPAEHATRIIFTSGTTGTPKGVHLSGHQLLASVAGLADATHAGPEDRYLSVLPHALLLEQIAGTYLPLSVGATILALEMQSALQRGRFTLEAERAGATATVLVPELLFAWLKELRALGRRGPQSLRFIAVGGAPVSPQLAAEAWAQGLPVYEGYGLSESCSVVCLNRPDARRTGTVGQPLKNVQVKIDQGEIVIDGPTVMVGYLGEPPISGSWRSGDLGELDADGFLRLRGRKDNIIVTAAGRNVSPEWIEAVIANDSRIERCVVVGHRQELAALIVPENSALCGDHPAILDLMTVVTRELPDYAKPRRYLAMSDQEVRSLDLLTSNQRPRRTEIGLVFERLKSLHLHA